MTAREGEESVHATGRWRAGLVVALSAGAAGVVLGSTALFLAATVGLLYAAYGSLTTAPPLYLDVDRTVEPDAPAPGERVTVTVTVENVGPTPIADLRLFDQPPESLAVVDGQTRHTAALEPGETASFSYDLRARRGEPAFDPLVAVCRTVGGGSERRKTFDPGTELACLAEFEDLPLTDQTIPFAGRVQTDAGGEGVEFYATRQFHPTDPMRRIDWNRFARTGELTTVEFRETRAATVVFVLDARERVQRSEHEPDSVELGAYATVRVASALLDEGNRVGCVISGVGLDYVEPAAGSEQLLRLRSFLAETLDLSTTRDTADRVGDGDNSMGFFDRGAHATLTDGGVAGGDSRARWLRTRLPEGSQVVYVSPILDEAAANTVRRLEAFGHAVTVVSPDVTHEESTGGLVARIERQRVLWRLQALDSSTRVVDWSLDEPLQEAAARAMERWSR